jgi:hypothetical protein
MSGVLAALDAAEARLKEKERLEAKMESAKANLPPVRVEPKRPSSAIFRRATD